MSQTSQIRHLVELVTGGTVTQVIERDNHVDVTVRIKKNGKS